MNTVLRVNDTARVMGVSRATIWNWANPKSRHHRPDFPKPIKLSENITGWLPVRLKSISANWQPNAKGRQIDLSGANKCRLNGHSDGGKDY